MPHRKRLRKSRMHCSETRKEFRLRYARSAVLRFIRTAEVFATFALSLGMRPRFQRSTSACFGITHTLMSPKHIVCGSMIHSPVSSE